MESTAAKTKDILIIIATVINILLCAGAIFGGMNWIAEVNTKLAVVTEHQKWSIQKIEEMKKWETDHDLDHARRK